MLAVAVLAFAQVPLAAAAQDAQWLARAAVAAADNRSAPFAVIDKRNARVFVFDAAGRLQASSPVLLGLARGDDSVPGIGERPVSEIRPEERTTPAGRFETEPGLNIKGEDIVWIDYEAAVSMHRVRATQKSERRLQRLASPTVADNRISYGCINVPAAFYDAYIKPVLGSRRGVVYVLPETMAAQKRFDFLGRPEQRLTRRGLSPAG
ncbi:L,D-transpeptidase [Variovorax sp. AFSI2.2]|uniref:L,D-transpeptidase n=1 Tax=Variovorax sp. AFSI2.2 TaxID=3384160 RepID=UPI003EBE4282